MMIGPIGFAAPWLLVGLIALPILWLILRAVPPAPIRRRFPGVALLLGLRDEDSVSDRTPWWLLLLRALAVAAVIVGLAGPVLNPDREGNANAGDLLVVLDGSWAGAAAWPARADAIDRLLAEAGRNGRRAAILRLTQPKPVQFQSSEALRARLEGFAPLAWEPRAAFMAEAAAQLGEASFDTVWFSDGLALEGREALLTRLESRGTVRVVEQAGPVLALGPATLEGAELTVKALRSRAGPAQKVTIAAQGRDPAGNPAVLATVPAVFAEGAMEAGASLSLPAELRARITRFELSQARSAGSVSLSDDNLRRREVALIGGRDDRESLDVLSPLHFLRKALQPSADLIEGALMDVLPANPDVIILADIATLAPSEAASLQDWVSKGGMLLRFAGPRLAASETGRGADEPLMPVRLRAGGRTLGGAMSWGAPKKLAPFPEDSPFYGLPIPDEVTVASQVMAQPDPTLADRVIAQLSDGTPLVTRKRVDQGQVVLFHVTGNAEWSNLPLSGLFVSMLERLAVSSLVGRPAPEDLEGTSWQPLTMLDATGRVRDASNLPGVDGAALVAAPLGPNLRPGLYEGKQRILARNVIGVDRSLQPAAWPARIRVEGLTRPAETPLGGYLLALAILLLAADAVATLALSGRLTAARAGRVAGVLALAIIDMPGLPRAQEVPPAPAEQRSATDDTAAIAATRELVLAHILTGDRKLDDMAQAGLLGLSDTLFFRTSVEPSAPVGVDLERDEIAFYPLLYWPVTPEQPLPSAEAYAKLNRYLRAGGMILFDTRDADVARFGAASPNGRMLQRLAKALDIPPLEPLPADHVLTRTFYLLQDFPGRHNSRDVWVEAAPPDTEQVEGMPFRNLNDGVTPVVIGGNDWAAAWATDDRGNPLYPVGRGFAGERQRELAMRFGVNLVMHVLTGNYKSDQVHVPALLDRLGQ